MDGFCSAASSGWLITPSDSRLTSISSASTPRKPITVALPTSRRRSARDEYTLAPSMPMNTNTVTSIMLRTCSSTPPNCGLLRPQMSRVKMSRSKARPTMTMNSRIGTSLATVVIRLISAASLMPRSTRACTHHSNPEAQAMASGVLPWPKTGKK